MNGFTPFLINLRVKMKKITLALLALFVLAGTVEAQNFFDDKWFDKPVKYRINYKNERFRIKNIVRDSYWTEIDVIYKDPYRSAGGWMRILSTVKLVDQDTGKEYPIIDSRGIPKEPYKFVFKEDGPVEMVIKLLFQPLPESVKTVTLEGDEMTFFDVAIGNVKPKQTEGVRTVTAPSCTSRDKGLKLDRITSDSSYTGLCFTYTAQNSMSFGLGPGITLVDPVTRATYNIQNIFGAPAKPEEIYMSKGDVLSFVLVFPALPPTVKKVNMTGALAGQWNIDGIVLGQ